MIPQTVMQWDEQIKTAAQQAGIESELLTAIVCQESRGDPFAMRYEDAWKYLCTPDKYAPQLRITHDTEERLQMFSYGLCQLMGSLLRELGFTGPLPKALEPSINLSYGAKKLGLLLDKYQAIPDAVSSYNQGNNRRDAQGKFQNQSYVDSVLGFYGSLKRGI